MRAEAFLVPEPYEWSAEKQIEYMDSANIQMQLLSNIPTTLEALRHSNDYAIQLVNKYPSRFGFLAALSTNDPEACLAEIERTKDIADGYAMTTVYQSVSLASPSLAPVWKELNARKASIFVHPNAYAPATNRMPSPLVEVAFDTARTITAMLYAKVFSIYPDIKFIVAHAGGALPVLCGRLTFLGAEPWVPNPNALSTDDIGAQMRGLYVDTAASANVYQLGPAINMCGAHHIVYGSDSGVPCSTVQTLEKNRNSLLAYKGLKEEDIQGIGERAAELFPKIKARLTEK